MRSLILVLFLSFCSCQLLGIDLGTMYSKVAMVQPGAGLSFAILENTKSQRKIETAISFLNDHRFYEQEALTKRSKSTANSFLYTKMFIDMINDHKQFQAVSKEYFLNHNIQADGNLVNFIIEEGFKDKLTISIEQVFGMIFKHIKDLAEKVLSKVKIQDCVLTVPYDWDLNQRIILINALRIAGLNPLYVVTENTAAAVHYGVNREANATHRVLFYNLGANYLELSVAEFRKTNSTKKQPIEIFILGGHGASNVGGLRFDNVVKNRLKSIYEAKNKKQLSAKGEVRLLAESKKVKEILSANKEIHVALEELDGADFHTVLSRSDFQRDSQKLLTQITDPIIPFLKSLDLSPSDIKYVQLIGGSIRMPKLQQIITSLFPKSEVGTHINGDEAMALGSAFLAANSSKKYKVKGLQLYDGFHNLEVIASIRNLNPAIEEGDPNYINKNVKIFKKGQRFGLIKDVLLKTKDNVVVEFSAEYGDGTVTPIKRIKILNISDFEKDYPKENPKLSLSVRTNSINVVDLVEAKLYIVRDEESPYFEQVKKPKKAKQEEKEEQSSNEKDSDEEGQEQKNSTEKEKTKSNTTKDEYQTVRKTRLVSKTHSLKLKLEEEWLLSPLLTQRQLQNLRLILFKFERKQSEERKLAEAKNKLQGSIYEAQELIETEWFMEYSTPEERERIGSQIPIHQQKLYQDLDTQAFNQLHREFYRVIERVKVRRSESEERERVKKTVMESVSDYVDKYNNYIAQNDWILESRKEKFNEIVDTVEEGLYSAYKELEQIKKTDDPKILNKQLLRMADKVKEEYMSIVSLEKPKKVKKKEKEEKQKEEKEKEGEKEEKQVKEEKEEKQDKREEKKQKKQKKPKKEKKKVQDQYLDQL